MQKTTMSAPWKIWRSQLEAIPVLAEEWSDGGAEEFVRDLQSLVARKRVQRESALKLVDQIKDVHILFEDVLAFFEIERAFLRWSAVNCPSEELEQAGLALAEWREVLRKYSGIFPPSEGTCRSFAAMQTFLREAESASATILAGFQTVDAYLAPRSVESGEFETEAAEPMLAAVAA